MSHYEIKYESDSQAENDARAIEDIKRYLGGDKFNELTLMISLAIKHDNLTVEQLGFHLMLSGVQGYPVCAWYRYAASQSSV